MKGFFITILFIIALGKVSFAQAESSSLKADELIAQKNSKPIIVYGSDTCHYCIDTKSFLKENKIDFVYYDVDVNLTKQREMLIKMQKAGMSVDNLSLPVIHKNDTLFMNSGNFDAFLKRLID
jgi:glutaredoxin